MERETLEEIKVFSLIHGTYLTDDNFGEKCVYTRIRTISYNGKIYYHKMINGNVVEFKVIGKVE